MGRVKILTLINLFLLAAFLAVVIQMSEPTAERALADAPELTPAVEVVIMDAEPVDYEPIQMPTPTPTVCCYEWSKETIDTFARGMYGLDSWNEKYGYVITVVNRYLSGAKDEKGAPLYGSATLEGIASNESEYFFYQERSPITDENKDLATFMLNAAFTERLTCNYTGFPFPSNAVLFGYDADGKPIVRADRESESFRLNYNWKGVLP